MTGKVNAIISGQSGVALLMHAGELASLHAGRGLEVVRRRPSEARFLLGDATDLQVLEDIALPEVGRRLELATAQMDALHVALILLDESLSDDTRQEAASELQELMEEEAVAVYIENLLFAHPLPGDSDLAGAFAACTPETAQTRSFLQKLKSLQSSIAEVHFAWEGIPTPLFGNEEDRRQACSMAARKGLFRSLVLRRATHTPIDTSLIESLLKSKPGLSQEIILAWVALLRDYSTHKSDNLFVAQATDDLWPVLPIAPGSNHPPFYFEAHPAAASRPSEVRRRTASHSAGRIVGVLVTFTWRSEGEVFPVREGRNFIGRSIECEICISEDPRMSARHACIVYRSGSFWIDDELSEAGTLVDGEPLEEKRRLPSSAALQTGTTVWQFRALEPPV